MSTSKKAAEVPKKELYYVYIENLPWEASSKDIENFFEGIKIPFGCISMFYEYAFIRVSSRQDSDKAMEMDGKKMLNNAVRLTSMTKADYIRILFRKVRRNLFSQPENKPVHSVIKRILPSFKTDVSQDKSSIFNPEEIKFDTNNPVQWQTNERKPKRKIKPTLLKDMKQSHFFEDLDSDSSINSYRVKKLKLHLTQPGIA